MEAKFTKGEWSFDLSDKSNANLLCYTVSSKSYGAVIADCYGTKSSMMDWYAGASQVNANANLIKTAPKMYFKLESILKSFPIANESDEQEALRFEIMDLLSEARGES